VQTDPWPLTSDFWSLDFVSAAGRTEREYFSGFAGLPSAQ
jgi:hypothetical protein